MAEVPLQPGGWIRSPLSWNAEYDYLHLGTNSLYTTDRKGDRGRSSRRGCRVPVLLLVRVHSNLIRLELVRSTDFQRGETHDRHRLESAQICIQSDRAWYFDAWPSSARAVNLIARLAPHIMQIRGSITGMYARARACVRASEPITRPCDVDISIYRDVTKYTFPAKGAT